MLQFVEGSSLLDKWEAVYDIIIELAIMLGQHSHV